MRTYKKITIALLCGLLGCVCFGAGDWLMLYGDTSYSGTISWLTTGATQIAPWRNNLAMALAFPGIVLYGVALFTIGKLITVERRQKVYHYLTVFSLTPWLCLHLFYIMILYGFAWMSGNGYVSAAIPVSEAVFSHFSWLVLVSEVLMLPPYLYSREATSQVDVLARIFGDCREGPIPRMLAYRGIGLGLAGTGKTERLAPADGSVQSADFLSCFEADNPAYARLRIPPGFHERPDEREHGAVVREYIGMVVLTPKQLARAQFIPQTPAVQRRDGMKYTGQ